MTGGLTELTGPGRGRTLTVVQNRIRTTCWGGVFRSAYLLRWTFVPRAADEKGFLCVGAFRQPSWMDKFLHREQVRADF